MAEALRDKEQFRRYIVTEKRGGDTSTEEYVLGKVDFKAMGEALKTVKQLVELKSLASGCAEGQAENEGGAGGLVVLPVTIEADDGGE